MLLCRSVTLFRSFTLYIIYSSYHTVKSAVVQKKLCSCFIENDHFCLLVSKASNKPFFLLVRCKRLQSEVHSPRHCHPSAISHQPATCHPVILSCLVKGPMSPVSLTCLHPSNSFCARGSLILRPSTLHITFCVNCQVLLMLVILHKRSKTAGIQVWFTRLRKGVQIDIVPGLHAHEFKRL